MYEKAVATLAHEIQALETQIAPIIKQIDILARKQPTGERSDLGLHMGIRERLGKARRWILKVPSHRKPAEAIWNADNDFSMAVMHINSLLRWMKQQDPEMYTRFGPALTVLFARFRETGRKLALTVSLFEAGVSREKRRIAREYEVVNAALRIIWDIGGRDAYQMLFHDSLTDAQVLISAVQASSQTNKWQSVLMAVTRLLGDMQNQRATLPPEYMAASAKIMRLLQSMIPRLRKYAAE